MKPLWKIRSGKYAGWRSNGDLLYNAQGDNVGYFDGNNCYSLDGHNIGEIYRDDWIGKKASVIRPIKGSRASYASIARAPYANRAGLAIAGWDDPDL